MGKRRSSAGRAHERPSLQSVRRGRGHAAFIPFSAELEHTRAYLAVEQAQFEDMLLADYDTALI